MSEFITAVERGKREPFDPVRISPSRVDKYLTCGVQFKRQYIDREPTQLSGSAALFGNVMHGALEKWSLNRSQSLVTLVSQSWPEQTRGTVVADFLHEYQSMSVPLMKAEKRAKEEWESQNRGKVSKAPRMTAIFKATDEYKKLQGLMASWIPRLNEGSPWRFSERDPLPNLYDESLVLAKKYSAQWRDLPASLHTEFGFQVPWLDWILTGYIDCIDPVLTPEGELRGYAVTDYKTYRNEAPGAKDHRQGTIYAVAFDFLCREGVLPFDPELPVWIVFDYVRLLGRKDYVIQLADLTVLKNDLTMYSAGVKHGVYLPAPKLGNPDFCDYEDCCLRTRGEGTGLRGDLYAEAA